MLLPWGVAIANRTKNVTNAAPGGWFKWHKKLQIIGALVPTFQAKRAENQSGKAVYAMVKFVFFFLILLRNVISDSNEKPEVDANRTGVSYLEQCNCYWKDV